MKGTFGRSAAGVGMSVAIAVLLCTPSVAFAGVILGSAQSFAVLAGETVTNTGSSTISGNVGVDPGSAITGFPPGTITNGVPFTAGAVALQAQNDERYAFNALALLTSIDISGTNLGGLTLLPGVYKFTSNAFLTGALTLDFNHQTDALFVFQIGSALNAASGSAVNVINGASTDGIFWQVGSSAVLGTTAAFAGNILAHTSVSLATGATINCGRAFAQTGSVTLDANVINANCGGVASGDFGSASFSPASASNTVQIVSPEPGSFLLLGIGLIGLAKFIARKK